MACSFSANQFEPEFQSRRLCNWTVPKWHPSRPVQRAKSTKIISNDRGHLLPGVPRPTTNPWGHFKGTWQLPDKISKQQAFEISAPPVGGSRWAKPSPKNKEFHSSHCEFDGSEDENLKPEYTPGDLTDPVEQHSSRDLLDKQKKDRAHHRKPNFELNDLYVEKHECKDELALLNEEEKKRRTKTPHILEECDIRSGGHNTPIQSPTDEMTREVTEKPGEQNTYPIIPAFCNFQVARKMHTDNLEHQPLPDSIMDRAFRKLQAQGATNPELALDVFPLATGVGVKTYKAGPTHCTKLKVYRPKTCGIVPKPLDYSKLVSRPQTSSGEKEKMGAMDLAICWDYRPRNPRDEPKRAVHIDGTDFSAGPAIFTLVKTPRTPPNLDAPNTGRSGGVFSNTFGEEGFFDKDIMRRQTQFGGKPEPIRSCTCGTSPAAKDQPQEILVFRPRSVSQHKEQKQNRGRCKSSPNLSQIANPSDNSSLYKENVPTKVHHCSKYKKKETNGVHGEHRSREMKKHCETSNKMIKSTRLCEQQPSQIPDIYPNRQKPEFKQPFKAGIPNSNASGTCTSFDSGCSTMSSTSSGGSCSTASKTTVKIPKQRQPYAKKDYVIDTLAPPFACWRGGAGQGGYPEHWRLASVYQHAYKPVEQRKRPLLATVYQ